MGKAGQEVPGSAFAFGVGRAFGQPAFVVQYFPHQAFQKFGRHAGGETESFSFGEAFRGRIVFDPTVAGKIDFHPGMRHVRSDGVEIQGSRLGINVETDSNACRNSQ